MADQEEIFGKIQEVLEDALGVDDDEVTPEATLIGDLGAESIDFLDIVFRLEKAFEIKIPRGELFPEDLMSADSGYIQEGKVTDEGVAAMREKLPFADVDGFAADPTVANVQNLYTVDMLCKFVGSKLGG